MATSTLIQALIAGGDADQSNRRQVETFLANGAIAAGDWVSFDSTKTGADATLYAIEAAAVATVGNSLTMGVSLETVVAGDKVRVVISGYCARASVPAATVAGSALVGPVTVAGQATIEAPGTTTGSLCGAALSDDSVETNYAEVSVYNNF
tara:strand:+ start:626 stop:1078 length:453 start_codon:yes stop_codon:yes gene_type:complete